ncbi:c-type cytochrome domain-containing protein [Haloferula sp. BvORR071]|uniref:c-type cytochrome domain-containing protein n=1 Tax=Haloferula sp. BvORR071 TaxID=1396141 RepID=UPI00055802EA|nr:c-type cytochrome domain-containing protein [Haloferula sp. BvORR071]
MTHTDSSERSIIGPIFLTLMGVAVIVALAMLPSWAGSPPTDGLPDMAKFFGRFHPVVLHLPIGMLLLVIALEIGRLFSKKKTSSTQVAVFFAAASAVVAVLLGFVLYYSMPGEYDEKLGQNHLTGGIVFACGAVAAFIVKVWVDVAGGKGNWLYLTVLLGSSVVMGIASHDGASLTHGKDYLTQYAPNPVREALGLPIKKEKKPKSSDDKDDDAAAPVVADAGASKGAPAKGSDPAPDKAATTPVSVSVKKAPGEQVVYTDIIAPILEQKCYSCHNAEKQKGKFRMDEYELLVKGGKEGEGLIHGKSKESNIIVRVDLPADDDEHMPPEGKKGLEAHEVALIKWWIDGGASKDAKLADLQATDEIKSALAKVVPAEDLAKQKAAAEAEVKAEANKRESVKVEVERLRKEFPAALNFESQASSGVTFTAVSMRKEFGDADLAKLGPVVPALVSLDLSASTVTDNGAKLLKDAVDLKSLRLSETAVTDAGLDAIVSLPNLESLNLYGTQVTNTGVAKLAGLKNLKKLYLWQTKVDQAGVDALKAKLPGCEVVMGL